MSAVTLLLIHISFFNHALKLEVVDFDHIVRGISNGLLVEARQTTFYHEKDVIVLCTRVALL